MRRYGTLVAVVGLVLALGASWVLSQDDAPRGRRPQGGERGRRAGRPDGARPGMMGGPGGRRQDPLARIPNLTDEQRKQIGEIRKAAMEKIRKIQQQMHEDIKKLLTDEQAKAFEAGRQGMMRRGPGGVTLTDEQKKILDDARAKAREADDPEARGKIMREAMEKVRASFTDEQKKQAAEGRRRPGGQRPEGAGRRGEGRRGGRERPGAEE